ncbi:hypothetical protein [Bacillus massilioanorexius]|uniref:hypothetical protein n=1 Tax=Bacillus massilioanorexius TaxID=1468413 RepID=UPI00036C7250|nr:hypothetical protein [Bacillus massilioanorexius]
MKKLNIINLYSIFLLGTSFLIMNYALNVGFIFLALSVVTIFTKTFIEHKFGKPVHYNHS